jgi:hypothetical protein
MLCPALAVKPLARDRRDFVPSAITLELRFDATHALIMEFGAELFSVLQELRNRIDRHASNAGDRPHRRPLAEHGKDLDARGDRKPVHAKHDMNFPA